MIEVSFLKYEKVPKGIFLKASDVYIMFCLSKQMDSRRKKAEFHESRYFFFQLVWSNFDIND